MIEGHFRRGVRYLWNKPTDSPAVLDGSLVDSAHAATQMVFDGLHFVHAAVDQQLLRGNVNNMLGFARIGAVVPYTWLDYTPGRTARVPIGGNDILTGYMSGCLIVRGTHNGVMSAFHVGTIDNNPIASNRVKEYFLLHLPNNATGFNPAAAWTPNEILAIRGNLRQNPAPNILALVTTAGAFHSILTFSLQVQNTTTNQAGQRYIYVGGIKQVPALNRDTLRRSL